MKTRLTSLLTTIAVIFGCGGAIALLQQPRLQQLTEATTVLSQATLEQQVEQESLRLDLWQRLPALGFDNLIANWNFLTFLQYFGDDEGRSRTDYSLSPKYFQVILKNDPYFWNAYLFLSGSSTLYAGQPDRTIEIMEQYLPKLSPKVPDRAYFIWRWKATDELLFLSDPQAAADSYQTAGEWAAEYDTEEGRVVAEVSRGTADYLRVNPTSRAVQVTAWMTIYGNAFDEATRQRAIDNIRALGGDVILNEKGEVVEVKSPSN
ncbi:MAG: hypothetical protein VKJ64_11080 [Leptolyngbyaceae bacterium]|nr:hypothetical protein [Leptolyngbyaceae bacterium]